MVHTYTTHLSGSILCRADRSSRGILATVNLSFNRDAVVLTKSKNVGAWWNWSLDNLPRRRSAFVWKQESVSNVKSISEGHSVRCKLLPTVVTWVSNWFPGRCCYRTSSYFTMADRMLTGCSSSFSKYWACCYSFDTWLCPRVVHSGSKTFWVYC